MKKLNKNDKIKIKKTEYKLDTKIYRNEKY